MTSQQLADGAKCISCQLPPGMEGAAMIYLLGRLAGVTDAQTIVEGAKCFACQIPPGMQVPAAIFLLNEILE